MSVVLSCHILLELICFGQSWGLNNQTTDTTLSDFVELQVSDRLLRSVTLVESNKI